MNIYLASRYSRRKEMCEKAADLKMLGHYITSRWIYGGHDSPETDHPDRDATKDGLETEEQVLYARPYAREDLNDVLRSNCFIVFPLNPRELTDNRGGMHFETGVAFARNCRMIVVAPRQHIFHTLEEFEFYENWEACLEAISHTPVVSHDDHLLQCDRRPRDKSGKPLYKTTGQNNVLPLDRKPDGEWDLPLSGSSSL